MLRASVAFSGWRAITLRAAPACTPITLTWWATTSCSSRAMRTRSANTACRAFSSRSRWSSVARSASSCSRARSRRMAVPSTQGRAKKAAL